MARILVVFSSLFGANAELAALMRPVLTDLGAEVRLRRVRQLLLANQMSPEAGAAGTATSEDLAWADGLIFTSPTHTGLLSASMKAFIDEHHDSAETGAFVDKTFTAMSTGAYGHAGQEQVVDELNLVGAVWGCILVPPSGADALINHVNGNPWGLSFQLRHGRIDGQDSAREVLRSHLTRFMAVTNALAGGAASRPRNGVKRVQRVQRQNRREESTMHTSTNPLRATDIFTGPSGGRQEASARQGGVHGSGGAQSSRGSGSGHSPNNPLRATDIFTGTAPGHSGSQQQAGSRGYSPHNPLRAVDILGSPQQRRS